MTRASFVGARLSGAGWWVFESRRGRVVEPYTPALAEALARVRMGEVVLDEGAARKIVDTMAGEASILSLARDSNRRHPGEAVDSGLRFALDYYDGWRKMYADTLAGALAAARRSLAGGQWESLPDWDAKVMEDMAGRLDEMVGLAEKTDSMAPGPRPQPVPQPPPTGGPRPQPAPSPGAPPGAGIVAQIGAWPAPVKIGAGIGAGVLLIGLGYALFGR